MKLLKRGLNIFRYTRVFKENGTTYFILCPPSSSSKYEMITTMKSQFLS